METSQNSLAEKRMAYPDICNKCPIYCCIDSNPPLSDSKKTEILKFLKKTRVDTSDLIVENEYCHPRQTNDHRCIFLDKATKKCIIHPVKPETCVAGPITFDIDVQRGKIQWYLKMDTICPLAGWLNNNPNEFQKQLNLAKIEIISLIQNLNVQHLAAILKIDESEIFLVGEDDLDPTILNRLRTYLEEVHCE